MDQELLFISTDITGKTNGDPFIQDEYVPMNSILFVSVNECVCVCVCFFLQIIY